MSQVDVFKLLSLYDHQSKSQKYLVSFNLRRGKARTFNIKEAGTCIGIFT